MIDLFLPVLAVKIFMQKRKNTKKKMEDGNAFAEQIKKAARDLYYISETDAEISPFVGEKAECVTREAVLKQVCAERDTPIEERDFEEFFARLTAHQDWFGDEEIETAGKFSKLKELLETNLREIKVFKLGKIQIDIYVVGLDSENRLMGIKTEAVET